MKVRWLTFAAISAALLAVAGFVLPRFSTAHISRSTVELLHIKQLGTALFDYAKQHNDTFPAALTDVPLDATSAEVRRFCDPSTKQFADWIYYPGFALHSPPTTIIVASPTFAGPEHQRIAFFADGSTRLLTEADFQKQLSLQRFSQ